MTVTETIENKVAGAGVNHPARLIPTQYTFRPALLRRTCWTARRQRLPGKLEGHAVCDQVKIARIQFALAGMHPHINHVPIAIVSTCQGSEGDKRGYAFFPAAAFFRLAQAPRIRCDAAFRFAGVQSCVRGFVILVQLAELPPNISMARSSRSRLRSGR